MLRPQLHRWAVLSLICLTGLLAYGQDETLLLGQLGSGDEAVREKAHEALTLKGGAVLGMLFDRMNRENQTANLWAKQTAERIVFQTAKSGTDKERRVVENALLFVVECGYGYPPKDLAFEYLSLIGGKNSVPVLAKILNDPKHREKARWTLERIPDKSATLALIEAFETTDDLEWKAVSLNALKSRGDTAAKSTVIKAIQHFDRGVRLAGINAAARIPSQEIEEALWGAYETGQEKENQAINIALLELAETWIEKNNQESAEAIYRRLYEKSGSPLIRIASLIGLAHSAPEKAVPDLLAALKSSDNKLQGAAKEQLADLPGENITHLLVDSLNRTKAGERAALITIIGERGDSAASTATPALIQIAKDAFSKGNAEEAQAAAYALTRIPGADTTAAIISAMDDAPPSLQAAWIWVLGERADQMALPTVLKAANHSEIGVRIAALLALSRFSDPNAALVLLPALGHTDQRLRNAAAQAAAQVSVALEKSGEKQKAVDLCIFAARATTDNAPLQQLAKRLLSLDAPETLTDIAAQNGFVVRWSVTGPFPDRNKLITTDVFPVEKSIDLSTPIELNGKSFPWKAVEITDPFGCLDLQTTVAAIDNGGCYLYAEVTSDKERDVLFKIGSDDDAFCWLNNQSVLKHEGGRHWAPDQDVIQVHLKKGVNTILLKVLNAGSEWAASLRITDLNHKPIRLQ